jgi:uncharacterized protein YdhG (YjbR/CyaY superfamily)
MADKTSSAGFSDAEKAAMKQRAQELKAEAKAGANREKGLEAIQKVIEAMTPADRRIAEAFHAIVTENAPHLMPKTWYGFPAYANADGKVVTFFKEAGRFDDRYATIGFESAAALDAGGMWPTSYAVVDFTPADQKTIAALVTTAATPAS